MLRLKLATDPRWVKLVEKNLEDILTDHAYCEQKAASTAISFIITYPECTTLVEKMAALAQEEMQHFEQVFAHIQKRGLQLGRERKDAYVAEINKFFPKTHIRNERLVHRLLIAALIEARSCERFKVLSQNINDAELAKFYKTLMVSEAEHYTMFLGLARKYGERAEVDEKWQKLLNFEKKVMLNLGKKVEVHG